MSCPTSSATPLWETQIKPKNFISSALTLQTPNWEMLIHVDASVINYMSTDKTYWMVTFSMPNRWCPKWYENLCEL
jgi:hypothetical protein